MSQLYQKPLPVGKTGIYTLTLDPDWLADEVVTSFTATCSDATVSNLSSDGNVLQVYLQGVNKSRSEIHWSWSTSGLRSDCYTVYIDIVEC